MTDKKTNEGGSKDHTLPIRFETETARKASGRESAVPGRMPMARGSTSRLKLCPSTDASRFASLLRKRNITQSAGRIEDRRPSPKGINAMTHFTIGIILPKKSATSVHSSPSKCKPFDESRKVRPYVFTPFVKAATELHEMIRRFERIISRNDPNYNIEKCKRKSSDCGTDYARGAVPGVP